MDLMDSGMKIISGVLVTVVLTVLSLQTPALAKGEKTGGVGTERQRYIVVLDDPPLAAYDGRELQTPERDLDSIRLQPTANRHTGARKLDVNSENSRRYLEFLDQRLESIRGEAALRLGRQLNTTHRYRIALNGFATELSSDEARTLEQLRGVKAVRLDEVQRLDTDSGPPWIGAGSIWDGSAGVLESGGEGAVIGIIDSGINWTHSSFSDPGEGLPPESGLWDHVNPYGDGLGLCSEPEVLCNDKLVGVYEMVEDDPGTDVVEETNNGRDNGGHGTHVASIAVGNPLPVTLNGIPSELSGVAPNANLVTYRVCFIGDSADPDDDGCQSSAIFRAIDQAIIDGVDVINYSIGSDAYDPWISSSTTYAFLNARAAGIFVTTSAGNAGPNSGTIGAPANAPWIMAVGSATHDRVYGSVLENLSGGDTTPPPSLVGTSFTDGIGVRPIVHARDYGFALCGVGVSQAQSACEDNTGATNPFSPGTFDGEIVVCDRGVYGRVEKGKNLQLAGAGGYVLANTDTDDPDLQNTVPDDHCLPATHINYEDGELLRTWLGSGSGHQGSISGFDIYHVPEAGDQLSGSTSRGPNLPPVENVLKPDVIAPGIDIVGASSVGNNFATLGGTSMASPHVAGAAALLKSVHPDWTASVLSSVIPMTSTPELAVDYDGSEAIPHKRGSGRPRLDLAVNAGLYLEETEAGFVAANPGFGGEPKDLNLPGLVDTACKDSCQFQRTVTDLVGGATWAASAQEFPGGVEVTVTPNNFTLANDASRSLTISIDVSEAGQVGSWVYGEVLLSSGGLPDMVFPTAVYSSGGDLPLEWQINSDSSSGWQQFDLTGLAAMPDGTFTTGGLVEPTVTETTLPQDPTDDDPYDGGDGVMVVWHTVPTNTLWLHAETLVSSAVDLDLFVGRDTNGDGMVQESEELCSSTTPADLELCDLFTPVPGEYWVLVQNWDDTLAMDDVTLVTAVVTKDTSSLAATGTGIVDADEEQTVRVSWDNVDAVPGTELLGAVGLGTDRNNVNNIGIIPVRYTRTGIEAPETLVLMDGVSRGFALAGSGEHNLAYVDVSPGTDTLTVSASGTDDTQSNSLTIELYRMEFVDAFANAPFATAPDTSGAPLASATGSGGVGPTVVVGGGVTPGRWYAVIQNGSGTPVSVTVSANMTYSDTPFEFKAGLWEPGGIRLGINQGYDLGADASGNRSMLWYTYTEDGTPTWYLAAGPAPVGNVWKARLKRFTNDGTLQQRVVIGWVSITAMDEDNSIFSFTLFGDEGSDSIFNPFHPISCPTIGDVQMGYHGVWSRTNVGVGGATVGVFSGSQGYVHYIYDGKGNPVWIQGANASPTTETMNVRQWSGFCPVCNETERTRQPVGTFTRVFADESNANWTLDYELLPPLTGVINRTDDTIKLTAPLECQ